MRETIQAQPLITLLGPTASGKTRLAVALAQTFKGEIISADSRQVYQGMDIGTGKDLHEYGAIPYHLINRVSPGHEYNLFEFSTDFISSFKHIQQKGSLPFLVGGTGLYLDAVFNRYQLTVAGADQSLQSQFEGKSDQELVELLCSLDPDQHNTTDTLDRKRLVRALEICFARLDHQPTLEWPEFTPFILGISVPREAIRNRISLRLKQRLDEGMIEEVEALHQQGLSWEQLEFYGLEYRYIAQYLKGELKHNDMVQRLNSAIHRFAKQQEKWFRKMIKNGHHIEWLQYDEDMTTRAKDLIKRFLNTSSSLAPKAYLNP